MTDYSTRDYILSINRNSDICDRHIVRNVSEIVTGPCNPIEMDCALLWKIKDYCIYVGTDNGDCISQKGDTTSVIECPFGEIRAELTKEKHLCCPRGEQVADERHGKAYCCPSNQTLKEIVNGKAVCHLIGDETENSTTSACPEGLFRSTLQKMATNIVVHQVSSLLHLKADTLVAARLGEF
ncbi:hypothetical protein QR680_004224 [Steinernema hermaphroditum]|uniref:Uncharacterized protein n=1 Tax=Steinernema hermaphroditum TaxID=289476 RepID=A0AA39HN16_9BILA|nr:hypothetical protein QR680_004224 [Steinernema hermaphroditum]